MPGFPRWKIAVAGGCAAIVVAVGAVAVYLMRPTTSTELLLQARTDDVAYRYLGDIEDDARSALQRADASVRIGEIYRDGERLIVGLSDPAKLTSLLQSDNGRRHSAALAHLRGIEVRPDGSGRVAITLSAEARERAIDDAVAAAATTLRHRLEAFGFDAPSVERFGTDRLRLVVAGQEDAAALTDLIGMTGKLEIRLVDDSATPQQVVEGNAPPGSEIRPFPSAPVGPPALAVFRQVIIRGSDIADAQQALDPVTNTPAVLVRFDRSGTQKFASASRDNVGKGFAIIVDGTVLSAPRIMEEIKGGQAQITGAFTVMSARLLAAKLSSGELTLPFKVIESKVMRNGRQIAMANVGFGPIVKAGAA